MIHSEIVHLTVFSAKKNVNTFNGLTFTQMKINFETRMRTGRKRF